MKAVLVVSFGTSVNQTREKTIDVIERRMEERFSGYTVRRAYTSHVIIRKLQKRDNLVIPTVKEALEGLVSDGFKEVIVQPTHILNGIENDEMMEMVKQFHSRIPVLKIGTPLLTTTQDMELVIESLTEEIPLLRQDEVCVWMGHGTGHYVNAVYAGLDYMLKEKGLDKIYVGTVEAYPGISQVIRLVKNSGAKRVILMPFMLVAGDHVMNDMAGESADSWKSMFQQEGLEVNCVMRGIGEYSGIQEIYLNHAENAEEIS